MLKHEGNSNRTNIIEEERSNNEINGITNQKYEMLVDDNNRKTKL